MLSGCRNLGALAFRGLLPKERARNAVLFASCACAGQNKYVYPNSTPNSFLILSRSNPAKECVRFKSKGKGSRRQEYESDSDDESDEDLDMYEDPQGRRVKALYKLTSVRLDNIFMKSFGLSRRKVETLFLKGHVFLNDAVTHKSAEARVNDIVEVKETFEDGEIVKQLPMKKIEIVRVRPDVVNGHWSVVFVVLE